MATPEEELNAGPTSDTDTGSDDSGRDDWGGGQLFLGGRGEPNERGEMPGLSPRY